MKFSAVILAFAAAAIAAPIETVETEIETRQSGGTTCGNNYYSASQINAALNQGCSTSEGGYPHQYNDYEGFTFPDPSPWYEFPIKENGVYTGGSPGADRVIFDSNCNYQGSITHTGASGNNFVGCSDTS